MKRNTFFLSFSLFIIFCSVLVFSADGDLFDLALHDYKNGSDLVVNVKGGDLYNNSVVSKVESDGEINVVVSFNKTLFENVCAFEQTGVRRVQLWVWDISNFSEYYTNEFGLGGVLPSWMYDNVSYGHLVDDDAPVTESVCRDVVVGSEVSGKVELLNVLSESDLNFNSFNNLVSVEKVKSGKFVFSSAEVTLYGSASSTSFIAKCRDSDFDSGTGACSNWVKTSIPFVVAGDDVVFSVDSFSAYSGLSNVTIGDVNLTAFPVFWNYSLNFTDLVGWWRFERSNTSVEDSSGASRFGFSSGGLKYSFEGKVGSSGFFDGVNDVVNVSYDADFNSAVFSIDAWVNVKNGTANDLLNHNNRVIVGKMNVTEGFELGINTLNQPYLAIENTSRFQWIKKNNTDAFTCDTGSCGTPYQIGLGSTGTGDDSFGDNFEIMIEDGLWRMWYTGYDDIDYRIFYANSTDGVNWVKFNNSNPATCDTVCNTPGQIGLGTAGKGDSASVYSPNVLKENGVYTMWYTGYDGTGFRIFTANSTDGLTWTKINNTIPGDCDSGTPCGTPYQIGRGSNTKGDDLHTAAQEVIKVNGTYIMYYDGHDGSSWDGLYMATSTDGINWEKYNNADAGTCNTGVVCSSGQLGVGTLNLGDEDSVYFPHVMKDGPRSYKMRYSGLGNPSVSGPTSKMFYATSPDGYNWTKYNNAVPTASDGEGANAVLPIGTNVAANADTRYVIHAEIVNLGNRNLAIYSAYDGAYQGYYSAERTFGINGSVLSGGWHHIVATKNTSSMDLYVDGTHLKTLADNNTIINTNNLQIGSGFNGSLDEVRFWNRTLSLDEILNLSIADAPEVTVYQDLAVNIVNSSEPASNTSVSYNFDWRLFNVSIAVLNMPFDLNGSVGDNDSWINVSDYSSYGNTAVTDTTNASMPRWNRTGGPDGSGAYIFDGVNDKLRMTNEANFDFDRTDAFALAAWVNLIDDGNNGVIFGKSRDIANFNGYYMLECETCTPSDTLRILMRENGPGLTIVLGTTDIVDGTWHHILVQNLGNDGTASDVEFYVDGVREETTITADTLTGSILNDFSPYIGSRNGNDIFTKGTIDQVQVFNRSLSAEQISEMYGSGVGRYNVLVSNETSDGDNWTVMTTVFDTVNDGLAYLSNTIFIGAAAPPAPPGVGAVDINFTIVANSSGVEVNLTTFAVGGDTLTFNATLNDPTSSVSTVWVVIWKTVSSALDVLWEGIMNLVGEFYTVNVPTNTSFAHYVNYSILVNNSLGVQNSSNGTFFYNYAPTIEGVNLSKYAIANNRPLNYSGLVGWWKLEKGNGTHFNDSSGNGNFGTCTNCPTQNVEGGVGGSYEFDGTDDAIITGGPNNPINLSETDITVSSWLKFDGKETNQNIWRFSDIGGNNEGLRLNLESGTGKLFIWFVNSSGLGFLGCKPTIDYADGNYHNVIVNYNSSNITSLHIDGNLICMSNPLINMKTSNAFVIGRASTPMNGSIDEVMIWNRSLSTAEILDLYNRTKNVYTDHDLGVSVVNSTDLDNDSISYVYDFRNFDTSIAVLNMPFELNGTGGSNGNWTTTKDYSSFGNNGEYNGSEEAMPTWNRTGGYDGSGAYEFDGIDDFIRVGAPFSVLDNNKSFSMSVWFNINELDTGGDIIGKQFDSGSGLDEGTRFRVQSSDDRLYFSLVDSNGNFSRASPSELIVADTWYHVVGTYDDDLSNATIYLNGFPRDSISVNYLGMPTHPDTNLDIGKYSVFGGIFFNGSIDQVQIFNRSLSAAQVKEMYADGVGGYNRLVHNETEINDNWTVVVTAFDGYEESVSSVSNLLLINNVMDVNINFSKAYNSSGVEVNLTTIAVGGGTVTFNATLNDPEGEVSTVWVIIWKTVSDALSILWEGIMNLVGEFYTVDVPTNTSFPHYTNWSVLVNNSVGVQNSMNGTFLYNYVPTHTDSLNVTSAYSDTWINFTANYLDEGGDVGTVYFNLTVNDALVSSSTFENVANGSGVSWIVDPANWSSLDNLSFKSWTFDGFEYSASNFTNLTTFNYVPTHTDSLNVTSAYSDTWINFTVNYFDNDSDVGTVYFNLTVNDTLVSSSTFENVANGSGVSWIVDPANWSSSDNLNFKSWTFDGSNYSTANFTNLTTFNYAPTHTDSLNVTLVYTFNWANITVNYFDNDSDAGTVYFNLTVNDALVSSSTFENVANGSGVSWIVDPANWSKFDNLSFKSLAFDGANYSTANFTNVTVNNSIPSIPGGLLSDNSSNNPILSWLASSDADGDSLTYNVDISNSSNFIVFNFTDPSVVGLITTVTVNLTNGTWYWRINAFDGFDNSSSFNISTFDVPPPPTPAIIIQAPKNGSTVFVNPFNLKAYSNVGVKNCTYNVTEVISGSIVRSGEYVFPRTSVFVPSNFSTSTEFNATIFCDYELEKIGGGTIFFYAPLEDNHWVGILIILFLILGGLALLMGWYYDSVMFSFVGALFIFICGFYFFVFGIPLVTSELFEDGVGLCFLLLGAYLITRIGIESMISSGVEGSGNE